MKQKRIVLAICLYLFAQWVNADNQCLQDALTQQQMNACAETSFVEADTALNRVYKEIKIRYADDPEFLKKLRSSQLAWIKLRDADLEMYYPKENKRSEYGSVYPMCVSGVKARITLGRVAFLKQWLSGVEEGDVCSGSIKNTWQLENKR